MKYDKHFARQKIMVDERMIEVLIMGEGSEVSIGSNLSEEMDRVSSQLAYWSAVVGGAVSDVKKIDAWYKRARAKFKVAAIRAAKKAPSDWKLNAEFESTKEYIKLKDAIALTEKNLKTCEGMVKAYEKKANLLQSKGAKMRTEMRSQGMATRSEEETGWDLSGEGSDKDDDPANDEDLPDGSKRTTTDDAVARMQEINSKKSKKPKRPSSKTNKAEAKRQRRR